MFRRSGMTGLVISFFLAFLAAEEIPKGDTESTVPELVAFHDVIYPIWHTAYPDKDAAALRGFLKDVNAGFAKIEKAKLPGILHDKQAAWNKGLAELKSAVAGYNQAAAGKDDPALLSAAETLHSRYEMMVRVIRPVLKEVDAFHQVLYLVYHQYLPEKQFDKIKGVTADMIAKAEAITGAKLPSRLEAKAQAFQKSAAVLLDHSKKLSEACQSNKNADVEKAVDLVHTAYQTLEKVFD